MKNVIMFLLIFNINPTVFAKNYINKVVKSYYRNFLKSEIIDPDSIWKKEPTEIAFVYLDSLKNYQIEDFALAFLDSLNNYNLTKLGTKKSSLKTDVDSLINYNFEQNSNWHVSVLELKLSAVRKLFEIGNYDHYQIVFDRIDEIEPKLEPFAAMLLPDIIVHHPDKEQRAKSELIKFCTDTLAGQQISAVKNLDKLYGEELVNIYISAFLQSKGSARIEILKVLKKYPSIEISEMIKHELLIETFPYLRYKIAEQILSVYNTPKDYKFVKDYMPSETDNEMKEWIEYDLSRFTPIEPIDSGTTVITMLDTLTSYTNQCYGYEWLKDETYKNELLIKLTNAENYLNAGDSLNCKAEVTTFQNSVDLVYKNPVDYSPKYVSDEGYKFLYYYAGYIIERL